MDRRGSAGRRAGLDYGRRVCRSGELRRRTVTPANYGLRELRRRTATNDGVEQCTREMGRAWVVRMGERGSAFYREREVDARSSRGEGKGN